MDRVKQLAVGSYTFTAHTVNDEGTNVNASAPFALTVYDGAGVQLATATPTHTDHLLTATVPSASLPELDTYRLVWTATVGGDAYQWETHVELVGEYLYTIAQFRAFDSAFTNATKYPDSYVRQVRDSIQDQIEGVRAAAVAFVPRSRRVTVDGTGRAALFLPDVAVREVLAVTIDGTAWSSQEIADGITIDDGVLWLTGDGPGSLWPRGRRNVALHYVHGHSSPPGPIARAALLLAKEYSVPADVPSRATATSVGDQLFRITVAGRDGITGIPDVDAAIDQFGRKRYRVE